MLAIQCMKDERARQRQSKEKRVVCELDATQVVAT